jgi:hypothetical protein
MNIIHGLIESGFIYGTRKEDSTGGFYFVSIKGRKYEGIEACRHRTFGGERVIASEASGGSRSPLP